MIGHSSSGLEREKEDEDSVCLPKTDPSLVAGVKLLVYRMLKRFMISLSSRFRLEVLSRDRPLVL